MDRVAAKIGVGHLVSVLLIGYAHTQEKQPPPVPFVLTDAYGIRSAAKKSRGLADFVRKWSKAVPDSTLSSRNSSGIASEDFALSLDVFAQHMDDEAEKAKERGGPKQTPQGYQLGNVIFPGQPAKAPRPDPKSWELVISLISYFEANQLGPLYGIVAVLCCAILGRRYTEGAIKQIFARIKKVSPTFVLNLPPGVKKINASDVTPPWLRKVT
jgi:hypothetical protein